LITAHLLTVGKWVICINLTGGNVGGVYGAAGLLAVLFMWVQYFRAILFLGTEVFQALAL
jgi:uncharacterized BrkB/YihY/UPF0761 family membrane protein